MVQATYRHLLDLERNKQFAGASDDITAYVKSVQTQLGMSKAFALLPRSGTLSLRVDNRDHLFSPEHASALAGLTRGTLIKTEMIYPSDMSGTYTDTFPGAHEGIANSVSPGFDVNNDSYVDIHSAELAALIPPLESGTISCWVYDDTTGDRGDVAYFIGTASPGDVNSLGLNIFGSGASRTWRFVFFTPGTSATPRAEIGLTVAAYSNRWVHVVGTWDVATRTQKIWIDGVLRTTAVKAAMNPYSQAPEFAGIGGYQGGTSWSGSLQHVACWGRVFDSAEIAYLYSSTALQKRAVRVVSPDDLVFYYPLDEFGGNVTRARNLCTTTALFTGWVEEILPTPDSTGTEQDAEITAVGYFARLYDADARMDLQVNKRADEIITALLDGTQQYPPLWTGWMLDDENTSALGESTFLGSGTGQYAMLDTGQSTFPWAGDNWGSGIAMQRALQVVCDSERGRVLETRDGMLEFWSRHRLVLDQKWGEAFSFVDNDATIDAKYRFGPYQLNRVRVRVHPRDADEDIVTLGRMLSERLFVKPGRTKTVHLTLRSDDAVKIAAWDIVQPVAGVDYETRIIDDADSRNPSADGFVDIVATNEGTRVRWDITNNHPNFKIKVRKRAVQRGKVLYEFDPVDIFYTDTDSQREHGRFDARYDLMLEEDVDFAENFALWEVLSRRDPVGHFISISAVLNLSDALMRAAIGKLFIGAQVSVTEAQTGVSRNYLIISETHNIDTECIHRVIWGLEPVNPISYWELGIIDHGELGEQTVLAL